MKIKEMISVEGNQLDDLYTAAEVSREDIGSICALSPHAPGRWRQSGYIPAKHLRRLAWHLLTVLERKSELKEYDKRALDFLSQHAKYLDDTATGTVHLMILGPRIDSLLKSCNSKYWATQAEKLESLVSSKPLPLQAYSLETLVSEIEKRGWVVNLTLKKEG